MISDRPHYLLLSEARTVREEGVQTVGHWRFVLESTEGADRFEAGDWEPAMEAERLELLTVIRGLEALDQPSRVTLVTPSRYVSRGLRYGLHQWRRNAWCWEYDGRMIPVTNHDLWQRIDRALNYHEVCCRWLRTDPCSAGRASCRPHSRLGGHRIRTGRGFWRAWSEQFCQRFVHFVWAVSLCVRLRPAA